MVSRPTVSTAAKATPCTCGILPLRPQTSPFVSVFPAFSPLVTLPFDLDCSTSCFREPTEPSLRRRPKNPRVFFVPEGASSLLDLRWPFGGESFRGLPSRDGRLSFGFGKLIRRLLSSDLLRQCTIVVSGLGLRCGQELTPGGSNNAGGNLATVG